MDLSSYYKSIEKEVGMPINEIRNTPLSEFRKIFEERHSCKMRISL